MKSTEDAVCKTAGDENISFNSGTGVEEMESSQMQKIS